MRPHSPYGLKAARTTSQTATLALAAALLVLPSGSAAADGIPFSIRASRMGNNPIISESMLPKEDGDSINGPSLIRVPDWVAKPLGSYYLYFAHHRGKYIRLAYADRVEGPWKIHPGGVLRIDDQKALSGHIASPEAVIDAAARKIYLYYHGRPSGIERVKGENDSEAGQKSSVASSTDGLNFEPVDAKVGPAYLRVFQHSGAWFAINGHGTLLRSAALGQPFEEVADVIGNDIEAAIDPVKLNEPGANANRAKRGSERYSIRHVGIDIADDRLIVYFTCVGHRPERIYATVIDMKGSAATWKATGTSEIMRPKKTGRA